MRTFEDDDPLFAPMLNALFAAFRGTAVMAGCEASATGTSRVVSIAAGQVQINGNAVNVGSGSVTLDTGSTFDRYDLISVDASGSKIVTKGATKRKCPTQPADTCLLAIVFVPAGATVIATGDVYDARVLMSQIAASAIIADHYTREFDIVDVPGGVLRKALAASGSATYGLPLTAATITVPPDYHPATPSNIRVEVDLIATVQSSNGAVAVKKGGVTIGSTAFTGPTSPSTITVDTTGGTVAGDTLTIEVSVTDNSAMVLTVSQVRVRSARSTVIPVTAHFVESAWP